ncbi:MAG: tRNA lysidine(34) synthetase TilS [Nitrospina sp.]|nr:tRNA lysidine(34) synthetase TilS [Nitrospina sp.]
MSYLIEKISTSIQKLVVPGDRVLVAVSGGVDSLALLYLLEQFSKAMGYELFVAHLNHLARGEESDEDAMFVEKVAKELSLPVFVDRIDIGAEKPHLKTSFQESARILRYQFLEKTLKSISGDKIAVGHTADDQIETVLMNLLRGTGLKGLSGMPEKRGQVIRPLLGCRRNELELVLKSQNLSYRMDSSNNENKYLRNKIRHDLIPFLSTFNHDLSRSLLSLAEIVRDEDEWISGETREIFAQLVRTSNEERKLSIKISDFQKQHRAIKRRLVREILYQLRGSLREVTALHVQQVLDLFARARVGSLLKLPGNVRVFCDYGTINFFLDDDSGENRVCTSKWDQKLVRLKVPGVTSLSEGGVKFHTGILEPPVAFPEFTDEKMAYLDFEKTGDFIQARFFQPGDHFIPLGMRGNKKLKSYFSDQKIPRAKRSYIPILTNGEDDIIWVYGERISDRFRITKNTKKVLFIEGKGP